MKTIVIQSYRTQQVPPWIQVSLDSVRQWAALQQFDYEFTDDAFLAMAPAWVREKCGREIFPVTDVARLYYLKTVLAKGYDRAVWVDADVLVFDPERLQIHTLDGFAFCHEVVVTRSEQGDIQIGNPGINNAVMAFDKDNPVLDFYRHASESLLKRLPSEAITRTAVGPALLQKLGTLIPMACLRTVGLLNPGLMQDIVAGGGPLLSAYMQKVAHPLAAANLSHFNRHYADTDGQRRLDELYAAGVDRLLASRGDILNRCLRDPKGQKP